MSVEQGPDDVKVSGLYPVILPRGGACRSRIFTVDQWLAQRSRMDAGGLPTQSSVVPVAARAASDGDNCRRSQVQDGPRCWCYRHRVSRLLFQCRRNCNASRCASGIMAMTQAIDAATPQRKRNGTRRAVRFDASLRRDCNRLGRRWCSHIVLCGRLPGSRRQRKLAGRPESTHGTDRRQFAANESLPPQHCVVRASCVGRGPHPDTIGINSATLRLVKPCVRCAGDDHGISIVAQDCRKSRSSRWRGSAIPDLGGVTFG